MEKSLIPLLLPPSLPSLDKEWTCQGAYARRGGTNRSKILIVIPFVDLLTLLVSLILLFLLSFKKKLLSLRFTFYLLVDFFSWLTCLLPLLFYHLLFTFYIFLYFCIFSFTFSNFLLRLFFELFSSVLFALHSQLCSLYSLISTLCSLLFTPYSYS